MEHCVWYEKNMNNKTKVQFGTKNCLWSLNLPHSIFPYSSKLDAEIYYGASLVLCNTLLNNAK